MRLLSSPLVVVCLGLVASCGSNEPKADKKAPTVVATVPVDGALGVELTQAIQITFSEKMDIEITEILVNGITQSGSWDEGETVLTVEAGGGWPAQTQNAVEVPVTHKDRAGNPMSMAHTFVFTTVEGDICADDHAPPEVISSREPPELSLVTDVYRLSFDESVSLTIADLSLTGPTVATIASVTQVNPRNYDIELTGLEPAAQIELVVATSIEDSCGNALADAVSIVFEVENPCDLDTTPPTVMSSLTPPPFFPGEGSYVFVFGEPVVSVTSSDLTLTQLVGTGVIDTVVGLDAATYQVQLTGLQDGDAYLLSANNSIEDLCGNALSEVAVAISIEVVDPCVADENDPLIADYSAAILEPPSDTYRLIFSEDVALSLGQLLLQVSVGSGSIAGLTPVDGRTFDIALTGLADGDVYVLEVLPTVVDQCNNLLAGQRTIDLNVFAPCSLDTVAPSVVSPTAVNIASGNRSYRVAFDEAVVGVQPSDLVLTPTAGTGNGVIAGISAIDTQTYLVELAGLTAGDSYDLTVGASITDSCANPLQSPVIVTLTVFDVPLPSQCTSPDHVELEELALLVASPASGERGNTNGVTSLLDLSLAEETLVNIDLGAIATAPVELAGFIEHFDPVTIDSFESQSDLFSLGPVTGIAGHALEITLSVNGAASSGTWGLGSGFFELVLLDSNGEVIGEPGLTQITVVGETSVVTQSWSALQLREGEEYLVAVVGRADTAPGGILELVDYCVSVTSQPYTPPEGATCSSAKDLTGESFPYNFSGIYEGDGGDGGSCDPSYTNAVWFEYTAGATEDHAIEVSNNATSGAWSRLVAFTDSCDITTSEIECTASPDSEASMAIPMDVGETYSFVFYTDDEAFAMESPSVSITQCSSVQANVVSTDPLPGATDVGVDPELVVHFDRTIDRSVGLLNVTGNMGSAFVYDLGLQVGTMTTTFLNGDTSLRIVPDTDFQLSEHVTVTWDDGFTDSLCGVNSVQSAAVWEFDVTSVGVTTLLSESFDTPLAVSDWANPGGTICSGGEPSGWVHNSISAADCTDRSALGDGSFAIVDSDCCGGAVDADLVSPSVDCSAFSASVELSFDVNYNYYGGDTLAVEVSTNGGASWIPLTAYVADITDSIMLDITTHAAGQPDVRVRFHYVANYDWYAIIDNVVILAQ